MNGHFTTHANSEPVPAPPGRPHHSRGLRMGVKGQQAQARNTVWLSIRHDERGASVAVQNMRTSFYPEVHRIHRMTPSRLISCKQKVTEMKRV